MSNTARAPRNLGPEGRKLWRSIVEDYELDQHELALLAVACRTVDRLEDLALALVGAPLTMTNSKGDAVSNPSLIEQRMQAVALTRLIASLRLPSGETEEGDLIRPQRRGAARGSYGTLAAVSDIRP
jgi:hypothetical protein